MPELEFKLGEFGKSHSDDLKGPADRAGQDKFGSQNPIPLAEAVSNHPGDHDRRASVAEANPAPRPVGNSSGTEPQGLVIGHEAMSDPSPTSPDKRSRRKSWRRFFGRNTGERAGVIAAITGVLALLVAVVAWLLPQPPPPDVTTSNGVPESYLGTWRGQVTMTIDDPLDPAGGNSTGIDEIIIEQGKIGDIVANQRPISWPLINGKESGCSRSWKLSEVAKDRIVLKASSTGNPTDLPALSGCLSQLTMNVRLATPETIKIAANLDYILVTEAFTGTLERQS
jgi:hypothetical protein